MEGVPTQSESLSTPKLEAYDEAIFDVYDSVKVDVLKGVNPDAESLRTEKETFLSGASSEPKFSYTHLDTVYLDEKEITLLDLKREVASRGDFEPAIKRAYHWAINEKIAQIRMLRCTKLAANGVDPEKNMRRFQRYSEYIYGAPQQDIFNEVMDGLGRRLADAQVDMTSEVSAAYERLLGLLGTFRASVVDHGSEVYGIYKNVPVNRDEQAVTDAEELKKIFEEAIKTLGLAEWKAVVDKTGRRQAIAVAAKSKKVQLPGSDELALRSEKAKLTKEKIAGLIAHELGTHAMRSEYARVDGRIKLLMRGFDRYTVGEEGLATYREHEASGRHEDYAGYIPYFVSGLAYGLDGVAPRTFGEVHQILTDYYIVIDGSSLERAKELAWNSCVRAYRGTVGNVPGVVFTKDILYREGNIATYSFYHEGTDKMVDVNLGKFDQNNERHVSILSELDMSEASLQQLDGVED